MEIIIKFTQDDIVKDKDKVIQKLMLLCDATAKEKETPKSKKESTKKSEEKTPPIDPEPQNTMETEEETASCSLADLQRAASQKAKEISGGVKKIKALLQKYSANNFPELEEKDYHSFLKEIEELV